MTYYQSHKETNKIHSDVFQRLATSSITISSGSSSSSSSIVICISSISSISNISIISSSIIISSSTCMISTVSSNVSTVIFAFRRLVSGGAMTQDDQGHGNLHINK